MENKLNANVAKAMAETGAVGMTVSDKDGMSLISRGDIGTIQTIGSLLVADAQSMFPKGSRNKKNHYPIVTLHHSDGSKTTVANKHGETVSILFK